MVQQHSKVFIRKSRFGQLEDFMNTTLTNLCKEMNKTAQVFYPVTPADDEDAKGADKLFTCIARTWVGIFNNSLLRNNPEFVSLQEFKVYSDEKNIGRCDFLFRVPLEEVTYDVILEAKVEEYKPNWKITEQNDYKKTLEQAYKYYAAEKTFYQHQVYLMVLRFAWVRGNENLIKGKNALEVWNEQFDEQTDFLSLYYSTNRGVFVYGKMIPANEYELNLVNHKVEL